MPGWGLQLQSSWLTIKRTRRHGTEIGDSSLTESFSPNPSQGTASATFIDEWMFGDPDLGQGQGDGAFPLNSAWFTIKGTHRHGTEFLLGSDARSFAPSPPIGTTEVFLDNWFFPAAKTAFTWTGNGVISVSGAYGASTQIVSYPYLPQSDYLSIKSTHRHGTEILGGLDESEAFDPLIGAAFADNFLNPWFFPQNAPPYSRDGVQFTYTGNGVVSTSGTTTPDGQPGFGSNFYSNGVVSTSGAYGSTTGTPDGSPGFGSNFYSNGVVSTSASGPWVGYITAVFSPGGNIVNTSGSGGNGSPIFGSNFYSNGVVNASGSGGIGSPGFGSNFYSNGIINTSASGPWIGYITAVFSPGGNIVNISGTTTPDGQPGFGSNFYSNGVVNTSGTTTPDGQPGFGSNFYSNSSVAISGAYGSTTGTPDGSPGFGSNFYSNGVVSTSGTTTPDGQPGFGINFYSNGVVNTSASGPWIGYITAVFSPGGNIVTVSGSAIQVSSVVVAVTGTPAGSAPFDSDWFTIKSTRRHGAEFLDGLNEPTQSIPQTVSDQYGFSSGQGAILGSWFFPTQVQFSWVATGSISASGAYGSTTGTPDGSPGFGINFVTNGVVSTSGTTTPDGQPSFGANFYSNGIVSTSGTTTPDGQPGFGINFYSNGVVSTSGTTTPDGQPGFGSNFYSNGKVSTSGTTTPDGQPGFGSNFTANGSVSTSGTTTPDGQPGFGINFTANGSVSASGTTTPNGSPGFGINFAANGIVSTSGTTTPDGQPGFGINFATNGVIKTSGTTTPDGQPGFAFSPGGKIVSISASGPWVANVYFSWSPGGNIVLFSGAAASVSPVQGHVYVGSGIVLVEGFALTKQAGPQFSYIGNGFVFSFANAPTYLQLQNLVNFASYLPAPYKQNIFFKGKTGGTYKNGTITKGKKYTYFTRP
jgi:antitoxin component YwqK of YwqJK toxin-antitoxin module